jgi:hypothetical protein
VNAVVPASKNGIQKIERSAALEAPVNIVPTEIRFPRAIRQRQMVAVKGIATIAAKLK